MRKIITARIILFFVLAFIAALLFAPPVFWLLGKISWPWAFAPLLAAGCYALLVALVAIQAKRNFRH